MTQKRPRIAAVISALLMCVPVLMCVPALAIHAQAMPAQQKNGCTIRGVVIAGQEPVADARVVLERRDAGEKSENKIEAESDASGNFVFLGLQAGAYRLMAEKEGQRSELADVDVSPAAGQQVVRLTLDGSGARHPTSGGKHTAILPMQFADKPNFRVAGITDWTAVGGHGSDAILRTSEALARETLTLKGQGTARAASAEKASETALRTALAKNPNGFKSNHDMGEFLLNEQRYSEAIPLLARAQGIKPEDSGNGYDLARAYEGNGELEAALKLVNQILAHHQCAELHRLAGELDEKLGNPLEAVKEYQQAVRLNPSEENYFAWGSELLYHRAVWQALEVFREGVKAYPKSSRMLTGLGAAQFGGALYDKAAVSFCKASDMSPESTAPYSFMGKVELASPDPLPCVESRLARFLHEQPESASANYLYAMTILKRAELTPDPQVTDKAQALLENAVSLDRSYGAAYLQLGILAYSRRDVEGAIGYYTQAIAASPQLADAYYRLGVAYGRQGKDAQARQEFQIHDELQKKQAADVNAQRRAIKQFQIVQDGVPQLPAKP